MKKLILFLLLTSCSAPYHIRRAVKKNPNIITEKVDTVRFTFNKIDTIERISNDTVYTEIIVREIDTMFLTKYKFIDGDDIKTRQEIRTRLGRSGFTWKLLLILVGLLVVAIILIRNERR